MYENLASLREGRNLNKSLLPASSSMSEEALEGKAHSTFFGQPCLTCLFGKVGLKNIQ